MRGLSLVESLNEPDRKERKKKFVALAEDCSEEGGFPEWGRANPPPLPVGIIPRKVLPIAQREIPHRVSWDTSFSQSL